MQKTDHKIVIKSYEYFSKNATLFIKPKSLQHDLKINRAIFKKAIERLEKLGYIEFNSSASTGIPYQLSATGIAYAQQNTKSFFEKIDSNNIVKCTFRALGFAMVYLLGLYTEEIKALINQLFKN